MTNIDNRYFKKLLALKNLPSNINSSVDNILSGTKAAQNELSALPHDIAVKIHDVATIAYAQAFRYGMVVTSAFALIALILAIKKLQNIKLNKLQQNIESA